jgi:hypothetical protein
VKLASNSTGTMCDAGCSSITTSELLVTARETTLGGALRSGEALGSAIAFAGIAAVVDGPFLVGEAVGVTAIMVTVVGVGVVATYDWLRNPQQKILYHYTTEGGMNGIMDTRTINPSLRASNPNDARYGNFRHLILSGFLA